MRGSPTLAEMGEGSQSLVVSTRTRATPLLRKAKTSAACVVTSRMASTNEGTTIIHDETRGAPILEIRDFDRGTERQSAMRSSHGAGMEARSARSFVATII